MLNFYDFINEKYDESIDGSIGQYISGIAETDERVREIVASFTQDIKQDIDMSNAINLLDDIKKINLLRMVEDHINQKEGDLKVSARMASDNELNESVGKRGVFNSFLKSLTALGFKDNDASNDVPDGFLFIFRFTDIDPVKQRTIFKRFAYLDTIEFEESRKVSLYYGLRDDMHIEYGYYYDVFNKIGEFKLTQSIFNKLKTSDFKSLSGFKRKVSQLNFKDIILIQKLKVAMLSFDPGRIESKLQPKINDKIITFSYYGYGTWRSGQLEENDMIGLKDKVKEHLVKHKWSERLLISVSANKFWTYVNFKIK